MTIASEITDLQTNLAAAKAAVTTKGGTVGDTGLAGLATEIASIPGGGGYTGTLYGKVTIHSGFGVEWTPYTNGCTVTITNQNLWETMFWNTSILDGGLGFPKIDVSNPAGIAFGTVNSDGFQGTLSLQNAAGEPLELYWNLNDPTELSSQIGFEVVFDDGVTEGDVSIEGTFTVDYNSATTDIILPDAASFSNFTTQLDDMHINGLTFPREAIVAFEVGNSVTTTPSNFLANLTTLSSVDLSYATSLTTIGDGFLYNARYNQPIAIPANVTTIGSDFLANDRTFNSSITLPQGLLSIGNNFLSSCSAFNQSLSLPEGLLSIGDGFFGGCTVRNQSITLPSTLTHIGTGFICNNNAMVSTVNVGSLPASVVSVAPAGTVEQSFCVRSTNYPAYATGITISASNSTILAGWLSTFPNGSFQLPNSQYVYRNLVSAA